MRTDKKKLYSRMRSLSSHSKAQTHYSIYRSTINKVLEYDRSFTFSSCVYIYIYIFWNIYNNYVSKLLEKWTHCYYTHTQSIHDSFIKVVFIGCSGVVLLKAHGSHHNDLI